MINDASPYIDTKSLLKNTRHEAFLIPNVAVSTVKNSPPPCELSIIREKNSKRKLESVDTMEWKPWTKIDSWFKHLPGPLQEIVVDGKSGADGHVKYARHSCGAHSCHGQCFD